MLSKIVTILCVKIGIYDPYLDTLGGGEKYMLTAAACLSEKHKLYIFWDNSEILKQAHERFGINIDRLCITENIFSANISFIHRLISSKKFDAIFYLSDGSIPFLLCKKLYIHFQFPVEWVNGKSAENKLKISRSTAIICNSNFTKRYIDRKFGVSSKIIYPPASGEFPDIGQNNKKEKVILSVGRFALLAEGITFKKQERMIDMFKIMCKKGLKDWKLILIISCRNDDLHKMLFLQEKIKGYPIKLLVNVTISNLQKYYANSSIYWHAAGFGEDLVNHPELAEHFGISTVQAMEQGTVPIVFNAGGQPEIVSSDQDGIVWITEEDCIKWTMKLIENNRLRESFSLAAREKAINFSINRFCNEINNLF